MAEAAFSALKIFVIHPQIYTLAQSCLTGLRKVQLNFTSLFSDGCESLVIVSSPIIILVVEGQVKLYKPLTGRLHQSS